MLINNAGVIIILLKHDRVMNILSLIIMYIRRMIFFYEETSYLFACQVIRLTDTIVKHITA